MSDAVETSGTRNLLLGRDLRLPGTINMDDAEWMTDAELRRIFDEDARLYDRARPDYPPALIADLVELTGIGPGSRVVEVGPGTGQATRALAATGATVTAIELGAELAAVLSENVRGSDVEVVTGAFEDWTAPGPVDVITSFTAWHWIDRTVRADRVLAALRPGGWLATVTTAHVRGGTVAFFRQAQECYLRWDPATDPDEPFPSPDELPAIIDEVDDDPRFTRAVRRRHVRDLAYTADDYLAVLQTYSGHRALPPERREGLLRDLRALIEDRYGGTLTKSYLYELRVARAVA